MTVGAKAFVAGVAAVAAASLGAGGCGGRDLTGSGGSGMISTGGHGGGIVLTGGGGSLTGAAGSGAGGIVQCDSRPQTVQPFPPDILIVLDTSASMNDTFFDTCVGGCGASSKWAAAVAAIESVTNGSTPIIANWGVELMTTTADACGVGTVAVSPAPSTGAAISDALASRSTPPALAWPGNRPARAAITAATSNRMAATDLGAQVIVLVTDGVPDCKANTTDVLASDADGAVQAITFASEAGFAVCIVGLGTAGGPADATLLQMGAATGSECPISPAYVSASNGAGLVASLNEIATQASPCLFPVPPPPNSATDRYRIGVLVDGTEIPQDPTNGWEYVAAPETFQLYGAACAASQGHTVSVAFRCPLP